MLVAGTEATGDRRRRFGLGEAGGVGGVEQRRGELLISVEGRDRCAQLAKAEGGTIQRVVSRSLRGRGDRLTLALERGMEIALGAIGTFEASR